ncbi:MAG TPA: hypothetical protein VJC18_03695 [bacterium]|nr:hypothetical protein [bacterium]
MSCQTDHYRLSLKALSFPQVLLLVLSAEQPQAFSSLLQRPKDRQNQSQRPVQSPIWKAQNHISLLRHPLSLET